MDKIKRLVKQPGVLSVLAFKRAVGRQVISGLDETDVRADDFGIGVLLSILDSPDSSSRADVEDFGSLFDRGEVQLPVEQELPYEILNVCPELDEHIQQSLDAKLASDSWSARCTY